MRSMLVPLLTEWEERWRQVPRLCGALDQDAGGAELLVEDLKA
jgi:hypothetical protein